MYTTLHEQALHREGLLTVVLNGLKDVPSTYSWWTGGKVINTKQAYEEAVFHTGLGEFQTRDEAGRVQYDQSILRPKVQWRPVVRSIGLKWTKQAEQKDLHSFIKLNGRMIADSAAFTMNRMAADAFGTLAFPGGSTTSPDGVTLFNSAHVNVTAQTQSNLGTSVVSYLSVEEAIMAVRSQVGDRGKPNYYDEGFNLICTTYNEGPATRATGSERMPGTNANDTAVFVNSSIKKVMADPCLGLGNTAQQDVWILVPASAKRNPFAYLAADPVRTTSGYDIDHDITKFVAHMEGVFMNTGWFGTYGANP